MKGVQAQLGELESWKKNVNSQLGNLAAQIPRPQGQLPGRPDENPRGQIAAIHLRSGKKVSDRAVPKETEQGKDQNGPVGTGTDPSTVVTDPPQAITDPPQPVTDAPKLGKSSNRPPLSVTRSLPTPQGSVPTLLLTQPTLLSIRLNHDSSPFWLRV